MKNTSQSSMPWTGLPKQTNNKVVIISDFMMYLKPLGINADQILQ